MILLGIVIILLLLANLSIVGLMLYMLSEIILTVRDMSKEVKKLADRYHD